MQFDRSKIKEETTVQFSRSSGPGGQHVNKVNTRVELFFDIQNSAAFTPKQKELLLSKLQTQLDKQHTLRVIDQHSRSQLKNKTKAFQKLFDLLEAALIVPKKRIPTKQSAAKKRKTLDNKRHRGAIKKMRGSVKRKDNWE